MRIMLLIVAPIAFWRYFSLQKVIKDTRPDIIFSHSVLRYVGFWGMLAIRRSGITHLMVHHDLGLITPRPSHIEEERDIPDGPRLGSWLQKKASILSILSTVYKYLIIRSLWSAIPPNTIHLVPSSWMQAHYQKYTSDPVQVFPHTIFPEGN